MLTVSQAQVSTYLRKSGKRLRNASLADLFFQNSGLDTLLGGGGSSGAQSGTLSPADVAGETAGEDEIAPYEKLMKRFLQEFAHPYETLELEVDRCAGVHASIFRVVVQYSRRAA